MIKIITTLSMIALNVKKEHLMKKVQNSVNLAQPASLPFKLTPTRSIVPSAQLGNTSQPEGKIPVSIVRLENTKPRKVCLIVCLAFQEHMKIVQDLQHVQNVKKDNIKTVRVILCV